ncbi:Panacea domain-containing protein, partial [Candidatus Darwinibacter acetoxidans]
LHFKRQGISMSGTVYVKNHYGPIPAHHETLMTYMLEEGVIEMRPYEGPYEGDCVLPLVDFDRELFSEEELEVLNAVLVRFKNSTARDLSASSHAEDGYQKVDMKQLIPYVYANSLKALN